MKHKMTYILSFLLIMVGLSACKTVVYDRQGGNPDLAYLQFISSGSLVGKKVEVVVDDQTHFIAKVKRDRKASNKPNLYTIQPGKRHVKVYHKGQLLREQDIYVSQQNTKVIRL